MPNIMSLAHVSEGEEGVFTAGIRATALAQVARAGYATPLAFVISCDLYETFLEQSGLAQWIRHLYGRLPETQEGYEEAYAELVKLFGQVQFSGNLREEFLEAYESLAIDSQSDMDSIVTNEADPRVRIIPSPNYQSTKDFSLALQQNLKGEEKFLQGIMKTWLAYFQPELVAERRLKGMDVDDFAVALLIEKEQLVDCSAEGMYTKARAAHPIKILSYRGVLDNKRVITKDEHLLAHDPLDVLKAIVRNQEHKIVLGDASGTAQMVELGEQGMNDTLHIRTLLEIGRLTKRAHLTLKTDVHCYFGIRGDKPWLLSVEPKIIEQRGAYEGGNQDFVVSNQVETFPMTEISVPENTVQKAQEEYNPTVGELLQESDQNEEQEEFFEEVPVQEQQEQVSQEGYGDSETFTSVDSLIPEMYEEVPAQEVVQEYTETEIMEEERKEYAQNQEGQEVEAYESEVVQEEVPSSVTMLEEVEPANQEVDQEEEREGLGIVFAEDNYSQSNEDIAFSENYFAPEQEPDAQIKAQSEETLFDLFTPENEDAIPILPVREEEKKIIAPEAATMAAGIFVRHVANIVKEFQRKDISVLSEREALLLNAFENRLSQGEQASDAMIGLAWRAQHLINLRD